MKFTSKQRFAKQIPLLYFVGELSFTHLSKPCRDGSVHFKIMWSIFATKLATVMSFWWKSLQLDSTLKFTFHYVIINFYKFVPSIQNWLTLGSESTKIHFCKPSFASANLKLPWKLGTRSPELLTIIPAAIFFTINEIMPGILVNAVSERNIRCCYSSHFSADELNSLLSSLQFESIYTLRLSG